MVISGTKDEVQRAAPIFRNHKIEQWHIYDQAEVPVIETRPTKPLTSLGRDRTNFPV